MNLLCLTLRRPIEEDGSATVTSPDILSVLDQKTPFSVLEIYAGCIPNTLYAKFILSHTTKASTIITHLQIRKVNVFLLAVHSLFGSEGLSDSRNWDFNQPAAPPFTGGALDGRWGP